MALDELPLDLELQHRDGLVHLARQQRVALVASGVGHRLGLVGRAGGVVVLHGEAGQRQQVDAVAVLQHVEVVVAGRQTDDVGDRGRVAGRGTHPEDVVVAPLDVVAVVLRQRVEDDVRPGPAVEDVADDVQAVDRQPLDHVAHGDDEGVGPADRDDRVQDAVEVVLLGGARRVRLVEQLLDHVGEVGRQHLAHLRAGVLHRDGAAYLRELVERHLVPVVQVGFARLDEPELLLRIVDQRAQLAHLRLAQRVVEHLVHLLPDDPRGVLQHVAEGFVLPVEVRQEVFGPLREVQDGFQVDDLGACIGNGRELLGQQSEILQVGGGVGRICGGAHGRSLKFFY